jgi:hypothetical protein
MIDGEKREMWEDRQMNRSFVLMQLAGEAA